MTLQSPRVGEVRRRDQQGVGPVPTPVPSACLFHDLLETAACKPRGPPESDPWRCGWQGPSTREMGLLAKRGADLLTPLGWPHSNEQEQSELTASLSSSMKSCFKLEDRLSGTPRYN